MYDWESCFNLHIVNDCLKKIFQKKCLFFFLIQINELSNCVYKQEINYVYKWRQIKLEYHFHMLKSIMEIIYLSYFFLRWKKKNLPKIFHLYIIIQNHKILRDVYLKKITLFTSSGIQCIIKEYWIIWII